MIKPFYITQPYYYAGHSPVYNYPFIIEQWKYLDSTVDKRITTESNKYISNLGRVYSTKTNSFVTPFMNRDGYLYIVINKTQYTIHRLVMMAFFSIENMESMDVNHRNCIKTNCACTNLEWTTTSENLMYAHMNGLRNQPKGVNHYKATLTEDELDSICRMLCNGMQCKEIAEIIGCSADKVSHILNGFCYTEYYHKYNLARFTHPREMNRLSEDQILLFKEYIESYDGPPISKAELSRRALKSIGLDMEYTPALKIYLRRICNKYNIRFG